MDKKIITVDFLLKLVSECSGDLDLPPIQKIIWELSRSDIPMTKTVVELGIICGALEDNYKCGWSSK